jgi:hypothetical protein
MGDAQTADKAVMVYAIAAFIRCFYTKYPLDISNEPVWRKSNCFY